MTLRRIDGDYVKSPCGSSNVTITRPDNTTAYAAGDVVGTSPATNIEFENILQTAGEHYYITDAKIEVILSAVPANMSTFTLHLYSSAPTSITDNNAWTLLAADGAKYLGSIVFTVPADLGTTLIRWETNINIKRKLASESTSIYGQLVTNGNYTPTSEQIIKLQLEAISA
jgi:hypothetical protein